MDVPRALVRVQVVAAGPARPACPRREHQGIRGLKGRVETVYRDEWPHLPGVELIQVCRGLVEYIDIRPLPFLTHAGEIFARHPVAAVGLVGMHTWMSGTRPGHYEGVLQPGRTDDRHWPLELFPEHTAGTSVFYSDYGLLILDLSAAPPGTAVGWPGCRESRRRCRNAPRPIHDRGGMSSGARIQFPAGDPSPAGLAAARTHSTFSMQNPEGRRINSPNPPEP